MKEKKKEKEILVIHNKNENPLYKKIPCKCDKSDIEKSYPLIECIHCQCEQADLSIPKIPFTINRPINDKNGNWKEDNYVKITEITLTNCSKYGSCLGWSF